MAGVTYLGTLLDLSEGSRLTGVGLRPLAREITSRTGTVYMHVVVLPDGDNASVASGAAASFIPAALATMDGNQPDGSTWFATFQFSADDRDTAHVERTADAAILRALELTGPGEHEVRGQPLRTDDLRSAYACVGDVSNWAVIDLLTGLLIELTNADLAAVVADDADATSATESAEERRRARLHRLLHLWASTYEGPAA